MGFSGELSTPLIGIEDPMASLLHLAAALWFAWQARALVRRAETPRRRMALAMFAATAITVLSISATYHCLSLQHPWKAAMQRIDHGAIFLLIAGTLTSFHAVALRGRGRQWMVLVIWMATTAAVASKLALWTSFGDGAGLVLYIGVGVIGGSSIAFLPRSLPWSELLPLALGTAVYIGGALAELWTEGWLIPHVFGPHELFHLSVVAALLLHWRFFHTCAVPSARYPLIDAVLPVPTISPNL